MKKVEYIAKYGEEAYQRKLEYDREYNKKNKEKRREYREKNKEKIREREKKYRETHKEQRRATKRNWDRKKRHMFVFCIPEEWEQIENYELAKADNFDGWHIHHRLECIETGGEINRTAKELQDLGLYYHRPANELIFLTASEHSKLHGRNINK